MSRKTVARYAAPVAFLAAVTAVILLVRAGLHEGDKGSSSSVPVLTTATSSSPTSSKPPRYYRVQSGDTLEGVAARFRTTVKHLLELNPAISPTSLRVGQRIRIR